MEDTIKFVIEQDEVLRMDSTGFYVRGVKVQQDPREAQQVYKAFREWLVWTQMTREY
jgi:hypothetical protein